MRIAVQIGLVLENTDRLVEERRTDRIARQHLVRLRRRGLVNEEHLIAGEVEVARDRIAKLADPVAAGQTQQTNE